MSEERVRRAGILVMLLLAIALVIGGNLWKSSLRAKQVVVRGVVYVEKNQVVQLAEVAPGTPLYEVDLTKVQRNVMSHYFIRRATVERDLPNTIRITVEERQPLAIVVDEKLSYLDDEGVVLPSAVSKAVMDLPVVSGVAKSVSLKPGLTVDNADVREALQVLALLKSSNREMYHRISEVQLRNGGDMVLLSAESGVPIIFGHGDVADKVARLEAFWAAEVANRGTQLLQYIDLRYADQVVARWTPSDKKAS